MSETHSPLRRWQRALDLDRFDLIVGAVAIALILAIAGVVLAGDQVGVTVAENGYGPTGTVGGSQPVRVRFSDDMAADSVEARFRIEPAIAGDFTWIGEHTLIFTPRQPFAAGQTYAVTIERGARAARRDASLRDDLAWTFDVQLPRAAYLAPSDAYQRNVFVTDLQTGDTYPITTAEYGVEDFAVSPSGNQIAYSRYNPDGSADLWLRDLLNDTDRQITACVDAVCHAPAWKPDGTQIAYQREDANTGLNMGLSSSRAWIVDLATLDTRLLFDDAQILGAEPTWSLDGRRIAVFDATIPGIRIHDYETNTDAVIETEQGVVGQFSPDGTRLVYPVLARGLIGQQFYTHLELADLDTLSRRSISGDEDTPVEDSGAVWSPDGTWLAFARRYLDGRYTPGKQIYLLDPDTGEIEPLVVDPAYNHGALRWDASGRRIVFQRFSLSTAGARPEIWTVDVETGALELIAENAYLPAWVP